METSFWVEDPGGTGFLIAENMYADVCVCVGARDDGRQY